MRGNVGATVDVARLAKSSKGARQALLPSRDCETRKGGPV